MPATVITPPSRLTDKVARYIGSLELSGSHSAAVAPGAELQLTAPHRIYTLPYDAVRNGRLSDATPAGWRYLVVANASVVASAEIGPDDDELNVAVNLGPYAASTAQAADRFQDLPELHGRDFEMRVLKVNSLYLVAAWAVAAQSIILPLDPAPSFFEAGKPYSEAGFFAALGQPDVKPFAGTLDQAQG